MSAAVDLALHTFGRHPMLDGMAQHHQSYRDAYTQGHGLCTPQEEQLSRPPEAKQLPRLPPVATMIPTVVSNHSPLVPNGRDVHHPSGQPPYFFDYATPSPVGQTAPQLPLPKSDQHSRSRRAVDIRRSPALSSTASDRSSEETAQRRLSGLYDALGQTHAPHPFAHQPSPQARVALQHEGILPPMLLKAPSSVCLPPSAAPPNGSRTIPPPSLQLPRSPPGTQPSASPRQEPKSMSISNLLSTESSSTSNSDSAGSPPAPTQQPLAQLRQQQSLQQPTHPAAKRAPNSEYRISVRQQPIAARSCGFGERDRRVIDPPPIVQLTIHDEALARDEAARRLRHQFSVVHCSIWDETGARDMSSMPEDFRQQRRLMGTLVASPFVGLDERGDEGCFFCFPDLSCRTPGLFRLKFALVVLDPARMHAGARSVIVATAMSDVFQVYNAKDFPGMQASTLLTKRLKEQGCLISIKKGNEKRETGSAARFGSRGNGDEDEEEGDDAQEGGGGGDGGDGGDGGGDGARGGGNAVGGITDGEAKPRVRKRAKR